MSPLDRSILIAVSSEPGEWTASGLAEDLAASIREVDASLDVLLDAGLIVRSAGFLSPTDEARMLVGNSRKRSKMPAHAGPTPVTVRIRDQVVDWLASHPKGATTAEITAGLRLRIERQAFTRHLSTWVSEGRIVKVGDRGSTRWLPVVGGRTPPAPVEKVGAPMSGPDRGPMPEPIRGPDRPLEVSDAVAAPPGETRLPAASGPHVRHHKDGGRCVDPMCLRAHLLVVPPRAEVCEGCKAPATTTDGHDVPLCDACAATLDVPAEVVDAVHAAVKLAGGTPGESVCDDVAWLGLEVADLRVDIANARQKIETLERVCAGQALGAARSDETEHLREAVAEQERDLRQLAEEACGHRVDEVDVTELIDVLRGLRASKARVAELEGALALRLDGPRAAPFHLVWCPTGRTPPSVKHDDRELARREAQRLAVAHPGQSFYVVAATDVRRVPIAVQAVDLLVEADPAAVPVPPSVEPSSSPAVDGNVEDDIPF